MVIYTLLYQHEYKDKYFRSHHYNNDLIENVYKFMYIHAIIFCMNSDSRLH